MKHVSLKGIGNDISINPARDSIRDVLADRSRPDRGNSEFGTAQATPRIEGDGRLGSVDTGDVESRAARRALGHLDVPPVGLDDVPDDREPEAGSVVAGRVAMLEHRVTLGFRSSRGPPTSTAGGTSWRWSTCRERFGFRIRECISATWVTRAAAQCNHDFRPA